ncbi:uncharacterized protein N7473_005765 [Penicillium subrubescens]|uniref:Actin cortical patch SUR7/pH-response regulator PalI n=1 Tax=Penicillium subrubescens TaxID=1316194 RepID=A0A1Q5UP02_9EURO|nr:uncharacterized protein N7473_005765 [Penicillium subrubescens]KAJ5896366.1 hypothetical protein N7473_005765 [Penicillium subrubescens]OKP14193.1 hypothetical protein PENSUB_106 [Penicillium subrubescens]
MIDLKSFFPTITAFIAFIITLCCLFAGTQKNLLDNVNLLTLYTPEGSSPSPYFTTTTTTTSPAHTFYSVHIMSYCQGTLGPLPPGATDLYGTRNVTACSNRTILFAFDPTAAWPKEVTHGPALEWPRVISDDFHAFRMTSRAMAVLYIIGVGTMGTVLLVKGVEVATRKKQYGVFEFGFLVLGSLSISIASIIATALAFEFVALINAHGDGSGVTARYGDKFLGMTWASTGLLILGSLVSFNNVFAQAPAAPAPSKDEEEG